jgi:hypothetical protein
MPTFKRLIRPHVARELRTARDAEARGHAALAFAHLERAHVLGQASTAMHVLVHWRMFAWGLRQRRATECLGQVVRLIGAATKTAFGLVPVGNTGGSNVSPFRRMPLPPDLEATIAVATPSGSRPRCP